MNGSDVPSHLKEGRLVALSKKKNSSAVTLNDIRPIVINSHITKIMEKAIILKLKQLNSRLLHVGNYQSGFKEGKSTAINLYKVLKMVANKDSNRSCVLFIDLEKAYDRVRRDLLFQVLR